MNECEENRHTIPELTRVRIVRRAIESMEAESDFDPSEDHRECLVLHDQNVEDPHLRLFLCH